MIRNIYTPLLTFAACSVLLSGCSGIRDSLGLERDGPDEFAVMTRAPLEIPSHLTLPPPNPGAQRPQEKSFSEKAQQAVFGEEQEASDQESSAEASLLQKAGANEAELGIRAKVDQETENLGDRNQPVVKRLLKLGGNDQPAAANVVDAKKEYERIKENKAQGKDITDGETPMIQE